MSRPVLSLVLPVYNEEEVIPLLHARLQEFLSKLGLESEVLFVNDGSNDRTLDLLRELSGADARYRVLSFSRNFGHQSAITAGLDYAKGAAVVVMDADLQDPPEVVLEMVDQWRAGYDVVYGQRLKRAGESYFKLVTARWFYRVFRAMIPIEVPLDTGDFRLMSRQVVVTLRQLRETHRFVRGIVSWIGFKQTAVLYDRPGRAAGDTKYPLRKMLRFAIDGITSFSVVPLRLATYIGVLTSVFSVLYAIWAIVAHVFLKQTAAGWTTTVVLVSLFAGVQLLMIGILGEYVGRIYEQVKARPLYIVRDRINLSLGPDDNVLDTFDARTSLPLPPLPEVAVALDSAARPQLAPPTPFPAGGTPAPPQAKTFSRPKTLLGVAVQPAAGSVRAPTPPMPMPVAAPPPSPDHAPAEAPIFPAVPTTSTVVMPVAATKEAMEIAKAAELVRPPLNTALPGVPVDPQPNLPPPPQLHTAPIKAIGKPPTPSHSSRPPPLPAKRQEAQKKK